jgi:hypothetical protein
MDHGLRGALGGECHRSSGLGIVRRFARLKEHLQHEDDATEGEPCEDAEHDPTAAQPRAVGPPGRPRTRAMPRTPR